MRSFIFKLLKIVGAIAFILSLMWLMKSPDFEPAITLLGSLGSIIVGFYGDNSKSETSNEKTSIADDRNFIILRELWPYICWEAVNPLLHGVANGLIHRDWINHFEGYFQMRQNPKYHLIDEEIEQLLRLVDTYFFKTMSEAPNYFTTANPENDYYIPIYKTFDYPLANTYLEKHQQFINETVHPCFDNYSAFIDLLRNKNYYHNLVENKS